MGLETSFEQLRLCAHRIQEYLDALRVTANEDRPQASHSALVDRIGNVLLDVRGLAEEISAGSASGVECLEHSFDLIGTRHALIHCQQAFQQLCRALAEDLVSYECVSELKSFGARRRGEWVLWSKSVKEGLDRLRFPVHDLSQALFQCWQDLTERVAGSLSISATNIGQQVKVEWQMEECEVHEAAQVK